MTTNDVVTLLEVPPTVVVVLALWFREMRRLPPDPGGWNVLGALAKVVLWTLAGIICLFFGSLYVGGIYCENCSYRLASPTEIKVGIAYFAFSASILWWLFSRGRMRLPASVLGFVLTAILACAAYYLWPLGRQDRLPPKEFFVVHLPAPVLVQVGHPAIQGQQMLPSRQPLQGQKMPPSNQPAHPDVQAPPK